MKYFKCGKYSLPLDKKVYVMGILNVTPDSFSDGGLFYSSEKAIEHALKMQSEGADIIDIGAQSTRPGHSKITAEEEWNRIKDIIPKLTKILDVPLSIDTFYPYVAKNCLDLGVSIINDVNGFKNEKMWDIASHSDCGCIIMHDGSYDTTKKFFEDTLLKARKYNISENRICLDPGIGFGKDLNDNINIIKNLKNLKMQDIPILMGLSKKSFIGKICNDAPLKDRLPGTIVANAISILNGANIIRVHDVKEAINSNMVLKELL